MKHAHHHDHMARSFKWRFFISTLLTIPILLLSPITQKLFSIQLPDLQPLLGITNEMLLWLLSTAVYFYGGWPFLAGLVRELRRKTPGMMTLIGVATTVAYAYSSAITFGYPGSTFFWELVTLIDIMLLGHWLEMRAIMGATRTSFSLSQLLPEQVHLLKNGDVTNISNAQVTVDDRLLIKPGEKIPADGVVVDGSSFVNEATLTGEPVPIRKVPGNEVIAGSLNEQGSLTIRVVRPGHESYVAHLAENVEKTLTTKISSQRIADRAAFWLTLIALATGGITFVTWHVLGKPVVFSLERMVTVLIVTCPHALGLAIPLVIARGAFLAGQHGLLIRSLASLERAHNLTTVAFDKTGTLTEGSFQVLNILAAQPAEVSVKQVLSLAASVEYHSEHPIARAITAKARETETPLQGVTNFSALLGRGVQATLNNRKISIGSRFFMREHTISIPTDLMQTLSSPANKGTTNILVAIDQTVVGAIGLGDKVREHAATAVLSLSTLGVNACMLTGDDEQTAKAIAHKTHITQMYAQLTPSEKAEKINAIQQKGEHVGMVGDGINDAAALAQADVSFAVGAASDITKETGDIILVKNDLRVVAKFIGLSYAVKQKITQNLIWALGYNIVTIPLAAGVLLPYGFVMPAAVGAIIMSASTIIVAFNSQLLNIRS